MAITPYIIDSLTIDSGSAAINIVCNRGADVTTQIDRWIQHAGGWIGPTATGKLSERPMITFRTNQLDKVAAIPINGLSAETPTYLYLRKKGKVGYENRGGSLHDRMSIALALVYWRTISLPHNGDAVAEVVLAPCWDGTNNPIVYAGSQTLAVTPGAENEYTGGPVVLNGTAIDGIESVEIASGCQEERIGSGSDFWDRFIGTATIDPQITIKTRNPTALASLGIGPSGGVILNGSAGLAVYAREKKRAGGADIKYTMLNGRIDGESISGEGTSPTSDTLIALGSSATLSALPLTQTTAATAP